MTDHEAITKIVAANGYGVGICPNPYAEQCDAWARRKQNAAIRAAITAKIESLFEPRFITPPETAECIEAIITMTDSRKILEIGTCTGFTTLHMLRAIYGKPGAKIVSIDFRPAHDKTWWEQREFRDILRHKSQPTPESLKISEFYGDEVPFDLVFVDSDHSVEHTTKELEALWPLTRKGTIILMHDLPEWQTPSHRAPPPVRSYVLSLVGTKLDGYILPTCEQVDCLNEWGDGYPKECNPSLGVFVRR